MPLGYESPPKNLAQELGELSESSAQLITAIGGSNQEFPEEFPKIELIMITESLKELTNGSAEGCKVQLEYARLRLPQIRNQHFLPDIFETPMPNNRKGYIDQLLAAVITGVVTSLDAYREVAQDTQDAKIRVEEVVDNSVEYESRRLIIQSQNLESDLRTAESELKVISQPNSEKAENLRRTLKDAENYNRLTRSELGMRIIVIRWLDLVKSQLQQYPKIIKKSARLLERGVDIFEWSSNQWTKFNDKILKATFDGIRDFARDTQDMADELQRRRRINREQAKSPTQRQLDAEKKAKELILSGKKIPANIIPYVRALEIMNEGKPIPNPAEIGKLTELRILTIKPRGISDVKFLSNLDKLKKLELRDNEIVDISILKELANLTWVNLSGTLVSDISSLAGLSNLKYVNLSSTKVTDIAALEGLKNLESLNMVVTSVSDISPLRNLRNLKTINIGGKSITDISPLKNLLKLKTVGLAGTQVSNINSLKDLINMTSVSLGGTLVSDITALKNLTNLNSIILEGTPVFDITVLENLLNLNSIGLGGTSVCDIRPLSNLTNLTSVHLGGTQVSDVSVLANLKNLTTINLEGTQVSDISKFNNLDKLQTLNISATKISDASVLFTMANFRSLSLRNLDQIDLSNIPAHIEVKYH